MTSSVASPSWDEVQGTLLAGAEAPVVKRYQALFFVRQVAKAEEGAEVLSKALALQADSVLLRHEAAYVLGQLGVPSCIPLLRSVLLDESEDEIVRHEAAEALAALRPDDSEAMLCDLRAVASSTSSVALQHTCELALAGLERGAEAALPVCACQYSSKDPADGLAGATEAEVPWAAERLADSSRPLYERYEGMFTLRNVGGPAATEALAKMLVNDSSSAVLRHEVAFVLGQMADDAATQALLQALARTEEHGMVRHEAAIALGNIGTSAAEKALSQYLDDPDALVAQSCEVAIATIAYWRAWEGLEARIEADKE